MRRIEIGGVRVEVDAEKTKSLYDSHPMLDVCQCKGCTNARMVRADSTPVAQAEILIAAGLDPGLPFHSLHLSERRREAPSYSRRTSMWLAYGKVLDADQTPRQGFDRHHSMWVDASRERLNGWVEDFALIRPREPNPELIFFVASNRIPWLYGETCGLRSDYVSRHCPACRCQWRETGYLKRRSLIPEWKGLLHLKEILREGKQRVYIELCSKCGHMDHHVVEDKPPFRKKSRLYKEDQRLQQAQGETIRALGEAMWAQEENQNPYSFPEMGDDFERLFSIEFLRGESFRQAEGPE